MKTSGQQTPFFDVSDKANGQVLIHFKGKVNVDTAAEINATLHPLILKKSPSVLIVDLADVTAFDDYGALILFELKSLVPDGKQAFQLMNTSHHPQEILSQISFDTQEKCPVAKKQKRSVNILINLGDATIAQGFNLRYMISFMGSVFLAFIYVLRHPKSLRFDDMLSYMEKTGVNAIPIVAMISFLLGFIMAFMSSMQLRQFGANIYVASLVAIAMVSELGPIMTAIIVAGRTGSAFAAEIGTMKTYEEVDALYSMGFDPTHFLVVPRMIASIVVVPILTLFSDIFAITGGLVIGVTMLKLSPTSYINQTIQILSLTEIIWGFAKSIVFASLVSWVACLRGFQAKGGAASVGNAATSAVVSSIFLIILFDSIFAIIRTYWG